MAHRSIATVCLSGTLEAKLEAAARAGFDGVELCEGDLVTSPLPPHSVATMARDLGLTIDLYQPFRDAEGLPRPDFTATVRRFKHKMELLHRLSTNLILVCSSVSPRTIADDQLSVDQLRELAEIAAGHGCRIAYEALAWGSHVSTWTHSWDLVSRADHRALGLCLDSFHIGSRGTPLDRLSEVPAAKLFFVQLADAPRLRMDVLQWSRHHRVFPGQGSFDLVSFTESVLATGYTGPLSLEVFNDVFRQADPYRTAVDARRSLTVLEDAVSRHAPGRRAPMLDTLPPPPVLDGVEFTEIAVGEEGAGAIRNALPTLGFVHTGQHRSKPVELWEQGHARVVLNADARTASGGRAAGQVQAIAVGCEDPAGAAARAQILRATKVQHPHASHEQDLATVLTPDGSEVIFCATARRRQHNWSDDFLPTGEARPDDPLMLRIDHVALSQPFDHFEEAGLFYRSVLDLTEDTAGEFAAPYGLVRTHEVSDRTGSVRIVLTVELLRRGSEWIPGTPNPQHVAFATRDVFETVDRLRRRGAPLLRIPDNYYDDLEARLSLEPEFARRLRSSQILYDRDADGDYLHAYTEMLGGRTFFEFTQRRGQYHGYGNTNAPVRMAAQRVARLARTSHD